MHVGVAALEAPALAQSAAAAEHRRPEASEAEPLRQVEAECPYQGQASAEVLQPAAQAEPVAVQAADKLARRGVSEDHRR